ncbi:MAG: hypothetical protein P8Y85_02965 [Nitrospirota bacterium]
MKDQIMLMEQVGFRDIEFVGMTGMATSKFTEGALFKARKYVSGIAIHNASGKVSR